MKRKRILVRRKGILQNLVVVEILEQVACLHKVAAVILRIAIQLLTKGILKSKIHWLPLLKTFVQ